MSHLCSFLLGLTWSCPAGHRWIATTCRYICAINRLNCCWSMTTFAVDISLRLMPCDTCMKSACLCVCAVDREFGYMNFGDDHLGSTWANLGPTWVNLDPWANLDQTLEMSPAPWSAITMLITCYSHAPWSAITYHAHYLLLSCSVVCDYRAC